MKLAELMRQIQDASGSEPDMMALKRQCDALGIHLESIYQELEMNSAYAESHRDSSREAGLVRLHSHSFYELIYCTGCDNIQYIIATERYRLQRGDIVWIPPGVSHCPLFPADMKKPYERIVLWVNAEKMMEFFGRWPELDLRQDLSRRHYLLRTAGTKWTFLEGLFLQGIREAEKQKPGWEAAVVGNTITLLTQIRRAYATRSARPMEAERPALLDRALRYMEENLARKITMAEVAHHLFVSESTLSQLFRRKMGVSFYRCLTQQRLIAAKTLIGRDIPLEAVSHQVGFSDYSTFYKAFHKEFGISPRQYRQLQE